MLLHKPLTYLFTLLSLCTSHVLAQNAINVGIVSVDQDPVGDLNTTAWALIYTYPLAIFANFVGSVLQKVGVNEIYHQRTLASPGNAGVIKPNVDTLYSRAVLDLSRQDVVLTVPEITDGRYWVYPIYDPYGNNVAEIGVVNYNQPGQYLIRRVDDTFIKSGYGNFTDSPTNALLADGTYQGIVNVPTTYATMLIRLLLLQNTTEDLNTVHDIQNASLLTTIDRTAIINSANPAPALNSTAPVGGFLGIQTPSQQLSLAAKLLPYNQPETYGERYRIATILARAGLYGGEYHPISGVNLTQSAAIANASITADVQAPAHVRQEGNNWQLAIPSYQGNYGTHYAAAAYVALFGYQQQTVAQTLYPGYGSLGFTSGFTLAQNESLLFTFSGKPELGSTGFWSLTVYGPDQYLIPNSLNRFEVGDRNYNITYINGGYVYGPSANSSKNGPFQILVQNANSTPPANWTGNWLPAAQTFTQILRWYVPLPSMTNGSYVYPKVQRIGIL